VRLRRRHAGAGDAVCARLARAPARRVRAAGGDARGGGAGVWRGRRRARHGEAQSRRRRLLALALPEQLYVGATRALEAFRTQQRCRCCAASAHKSVLRACWLLNLLLDAALPLLDEAAEAETVDSLRRAVPFVARLFAGETLSAAVAERKAIAIVHCCGFDSVPSDLGALFVQDYVARQHGASGHSLARLHGYVAASRGGASGGTVASAANLFASVPSSELKASMRPDSLVPESVPAALRPRDKDLRFARYDDVARAYVAPWFMESVNTRVVRRSAALRDGRTYPYTERLLMPNALLAYAASLVMLVAMLALALPPTRWFLLKFVLPSSGQGPDRQTVLNGFFKLKFVGFTALGPSATGVARRIAATVEGKRDPGYGWTARCITECALSLLNRKECRIGATGGGVLTPASAIGSSLFVGLERAGTTFTIVEDIESK
jgi:short subunit dehydrogenase-like uncharacterized protein